MSFDFPASPGVGDTFTSGGVTYEWNGYGWVIQEPPAPPPGIGLIYVQETPPVGAPDNSLWWDSDVGKMFVRYNDGSSTQWVEVVAMPVSGSDTFVLKAGDVMTGQLKAVGDPAAPEDMARKAYVDAAIAAAITAASSALFTTGDAKLTYKAVADPGWILINDGSIGNAASGATTRANADTAALFTFMYGSYTGLVVQDSAGATVARGANAAADYAANRRLVLPRALGRGIAIGGAGSGLSARSPGGWDGSETETPTLAKTASHNHPLSIANDTAGTAAYLKAVMWGPVPSLNSDSVGGGSPLNIIPPRTYMSIMIKL